MNDFTEDEIIERNNKAKIILASLKSNPVEEKFDGIEGYLKGIIMNQRSILKKLVDIEEKLDGR